MFMSCLGVVGWGKTLKFMVSITSEHNSSSSRYTCVASWLILWIENWKVFVLLKNVSQKLDTGASKLVSGYSVTFHHPWNRQFKKMLVIRLMV